MYALSALVTSLRLSPSIDRAFRESCCHEDLKEAAALAAIFTGCRISSHVSSLLQKSDSSV